MFLNIVQLKKLLQNTYKTTGLFVGRLEGRLIVCDGHFGFSLEENFIPNKLKGALAELIGDLPEEGTIYKYTKEFQQAEMDFDRFDFYQQWKEAKDCAIVTPVIYHEWLSDYALYQIRSTGGLGAINRIYTDLISDKYLDSSEDMPGRPSCHGRGGILYWKNDIMIYFAAGIVMKENTNNFLLPQLEKIQFTEKEMMAADQEWETGLNVPYL